MNASIKFGEAQKLLFQAKVPFKFLGFPFRSAIVAGESKELSLNLKTFFESGPSLKVAYRPNDSLNPFSLLFTTGSRHFGSPISSSFNMDAEFNLIGDVKKPSFYVHFKPDLFVRKGQSSVFKKQIPGDACKNFSNSPLKFPAFGLGVLLDVEMTATVAVPFRKSATLSFRSDVRFPATEDSSMVLMKISNPMAGISFQKLPYLILNKIRIDGKVVPGLIDAAAFLDVKKRLKILQAENVALKKTMEEFFTRLEITNGTSKKAVDYLYREIITETVIRLMGCAIVGRCLKS